MPLTGLADRILRFSLPIFEHIERSRSAADSSVEAHRQAIVHEHLQRALVEVIADDLRREGRHHQHFVHDVPSDLLAQHVASTFLLVLNWWAKSGEPLPSRKVNELFRALILPALTALLGP
jgi:hypothetical protein